MISFISNLLSDNLAGLAFFLSCAFIVSSLAYINKYYDLPYKRFKGPNIPLQTLFATFFIFITFYFLVLPLFLSSIYRLIPQEFRKTYVLAGHIATFLITGIFLFIYCFKQERSEMLKIWKDKTFPNNLSLKEDLEIGFISWVIAMPVVASITTLTEILVSLFLVSPEKNEQVAVKYLKNSLNDPGSTAVAFFSILVVAPFLEEFLFRGVLQSYFRKITGPMLAIFISSLIFSLFHFSPTQGVENIPLLVTLFAFGSYLGFCYEKTRSLFTSIFLHVTFNSISVIRIIFTHV
ncbi:MAG: CPBP family intramembrane metalloprotease [Chlamydiae bacterium]|nr:CPBP family intramembrane metalloprotease [Chlamydiota bacterium]